MFGMKGYSKLFESFKKFHYQNNDYFLFISLFKKVIHISNIHVTIYSR